MDGNPTHFTPSLSTWTTCKTLENLHNNDNFLILATIKEILKNN